MIHAILASFLLLLPAPPAQPAATRAPRKEIEYKPRFAADFAFLQPGKTTMDEAVATLGYRKWAYRTYLVKGELILFPGLTDLFELHERAGDRQTEHLEVLVYTAGDTGGDHAYLAFRDNVLLYASYPVSPSENTREKIVARYGKALVIYRDAPTKHHPVIIYSAHLLTIPGENFSFFEDLNGKVLYRVIQAPGIAVPNIMIGDLRDESRRRNEIARRKGIPGIAVTDGKDAGTGMDAGTKTDGGTGPMKTGGCGCGQTENSSPLWLALLAVLGYLRFNPNGGRRHGTEARDRT